MVEFHTLLMQVHIGGYSREGSSFKAQGIRTLVHRRYDPDTQENDVALVLLDRPSTQIPIRLPLGATACYRLSLLGACQLCLLVWAQTMRRSLHFSTTTRQSFAYKTCHQMVCTWLFAGRPSPAVEPGTLLTAIGFGVLWDHGPPARFLQEVSMVDAAVMISALSSFLHDRLLWCTSAYHNGGP